MEYQKMTDAQLAMIMINYITRVDHLGKLIGYYLDGADNGSIEADRIKVFYKQLKYELREDAGYLELMRNKKAAIFTCITSLLVFEKLRLGDFAAMLMAQLISNHIALSQMPIIS